MNRNRIVIRLLAALCLPLSVWSQDAASKPPCKQYYGILWWDEKIGFMPYLDKEQKEWWQKKGSKKYHSECLDAEKATYWIVWGTQIQTVKIDVPELRSAITTTEVPGEGTIRSRTVWTEHRTEARNYKYARVFVFATDGRPVSQGGQLITRPPAFFSEHVGKWRWSKPTKDALEDALKFISSLR